MHAYCVTIDEEGAEYLPHMYGAAYVAVLDDVAVLPLKVPDIYRKRTSWPRPETNCQVMEG